MVALKCLNNSKNKCECLDNSSKNKFEEFLQEQPFYEIPHDGLLVVGICYNGLRPKIKEELPNLFKQLINACWNAIPANRPCANTLVEIFNEWMIEINKPTSELHIQIKELTTTNKRQNNIYSEPDKMNPEACYMSRLLDYTISNQ
ncbi:249_t:CDS:2, partial [Scutellospora calospora]